MPETNDAAPKSKRRLKVVKSIIELLILLCILVGIPLYIYLFHHDIIEQLSSLDDVENLLDKYRTTSIFIYLGVEVLQILISVLPGQVIQMAGGYMYGFGLGYLLTIIGLFAGTIVTYFVAKVLGHDTVLTLFGEERVQKLLDRLNSKRAIVLIFVIYIIPGLPKDLCCYAAGISKIRLWPFVLISMVGRTPGMIGSILIGGQIQSGNYVVAVIIAAVIVALLVLVLVYRKKVTAFFNRIYDRWFQPDQTDERIEKDKEVEKDKKIETEAR